MSRETHPSKNEKPLLPHPEPSMTVVKTHCGLCLFGVRISRAMHMQIDAMTVADLVAIQRQARSDLLLIGANQRMMRCNQLVGKEQIVPNKQSTKMARRTI